MCGLGAPTETHGLLSRLTQYKGTQLKLAFDSAISGAIIGPFGIAQVSLAGASLEKMIAVCRPILRMCAMGERRSLFDENSPLDAGHLWQWVLRVLRWACIFSVLTVLSDRVTMNFAVLCSFWS